MKVNVEIELDWLDEDYNLSEQVENEVVDRLVAEIRKGISKSLGRRVSQKVSILTDKWIMDQLHSFCDRKINITDKWGDTTEHHESVTEMFKAKFDEFFNASVNEQGKTLKSCSVGSRTTRIDHILDQKANKYIAELTRDIDNKVSRIINAKLAEKTKQIVADKVLKHMQAMADDK